MGGLYLLRIEMSSCDPGYHVRRLNMGKIAKDTIKQSLFVFFLIASSCQIKKNIIERILTSDRLYYDNNYPMIECWTCKLIYDENQFWHQQITWQSRYPWWHPLFLWNLIYIQNVFIICPEVSMTVFIKKKISDI